MISVHKTPTQYSLGGSEDTECNSLIPDPLSTQINSIGIPWQEVCKEVKE
jgi:hypothetical protein